MNEQLLRELLTPSTVRKRKTVFFIVKNFPQSIEDIAYQASMNLSDAYLILADLEEDGLVICHSERAGEWRLAHA